MLQVSKHLALDVLRPWLTRALMKKPMSYGDMCLFFIHQLTYPVLAICRECQWPECTELTVVSPILRSAILDLLPWTIVSCANGAKARAQRELGALEVKTDQG
jgi:hypothetical protein